MMGGGNLSFKHPVQHWQSRCQKELWFSAEESRLLLFILNGGAGGFSSTSRLSDIFSSPHSLLQRQNTKHACQVRCWLMGRGGKPAAGQGRLGRKAGCL